MSDAKEAARLQQFMSNPASFEQMMQTMMSGMGGPARGPDINSEEWFVAKWEKHFLHGKKLEGKELKHTLFTRSALLPVLIDTMRKAGDPDVPKARRKQDRSILLHSIEHMRPPVTPREDEIMLATSAATGNEHVGLPSAPLPAGGMRELEKAFSYVSIDEMELDLVHKGRYTVVRQLARPLKQTGITTIVEDLEGTAIMLGIYNLLVSSRSLHDASFAVPVSSILLILDPYLKTNATGQSVLLRCDNPTHIIPLNLVLDSLPPALRHRLAAWLAQGPAVPTPAPPGPIGKAPYSLAAEGNALFKQGKCAHAAAKYTLALELLHDDPVTLSSRAQCMLNLGEVGMAARDARKAHTLAPGSARGALRLCKALYALQCWEEAAVLAGSECLTGNAEAKGLLEALTTLLSQKKPSEKDLEDLVRRRFAEGKTEGDMLGGGGVVGGYVADFIEVRDVEGKGRGMFAKEDIPAGTLLCVSKAIA